MKRTIPSPTVRDTREREGRGARPRVWGSPVWSVAPRGLAVLAHARALCSWLGLFTLFTFIGMESLDYESEIVGSMNTLNNWIHSKSHAQTDSNLTLTLLAAVNGNKINASILKYVKEI